MGQNRTYLRLRQVGKFFFSMVAACFVLAAGFYALAWATHHPEAARSIGLVLLFIWITLSIYNGLQDGRE